MLDSIEIVTTAPQLTACIHLTVPVAEVRNVMGPGLSEVMAAIAAQHIAPAGPWFTYHFHKPTDVFDFKISVPVAKPITAVGRVQPGELPARKVARTNYHGAYEGLPAAWGSFMTWIEGHGHKPAEDLWECYAVGPESGRDPAAWRTELNRPLLD